MDLKLSRKITKPDFPGEFTASILAAAASPDVISFAGGLPNPVSFPVEEMDAAVHKVMQEKGAVALQYSNTQGYQPLRAWIAKRYEVLGVTDVEADDIIITNGSQQGLEMVGATLIDPGDKVLVENPTYLVALQSFHLYDPEIIPVRINPDGIDCDALQAAIDANPEAKFIYVIPNFQNPTGLTYADEVRERAAEILRRSNLLVLEDNPYSELRFTGRNGKSFGADLGEQCCMFGTFSKIVSPGMRIGWICCRHKALRDKLLSYKSTSDLHTNIFCQMVLAQYLADNDLDKHIEKTKALYKQKAALMTDCMRKYLPAGVKFTPTEGGMFLWAELPEGLTAIEVYREALARGVAICPGDPFYEIERGVRTFRLNYSNSTDEAIEKGMQILGEVCAELMAK